MNIEKEISIVSRNRSPAAPKQPHSSFTKTHSKSKSSAQRLAPLIKSIVALVAFLCGFLLSLKQIHAAQATEEEIAAAQGMEAIFVGQMIEEMRKTVPESELIPASYAEKIYRSMLDQEYSNIISRSGQFGIAEQVLAEIKGER